MGLKSPRKLGDHMIPSILKLEKHSPITMFEGSICHQGEWYSQLGKSKDGA